MVDAAEARRRAERCFAVARSTNFPAERETAVKRGEAIANAAGLSLDDFDIPGRVKAEPRRPRMSTADLFGSRSNLEEILRSFEETIRGWPRSSFADAHFNAVREEQRRRADAWTNRPRDSDPNRSGTALNRLRADLAVNFLWKLDVRVYPTTAGADGERLFVVPDESELEYDDLGIVEVAKRRGWLAEEEAAKVHPFAVQAAQFLRSRGVEVRANAGGRDWTVVGDGISYFDKAGHQMIMALARQRGWQPQGSRP
jgi:hypothetical protein